MGKHLSLDAETNGAGPALQLQSSVSRGGVHRSYSLQYEILWGLLANLAILTDELGSSSDRNVGNRGLWKDTNTIR